MIFCQFNNNNPSICSNHGIFDSQNKKCICDTGFETDLYDFEKTGIECDYTFNRIPGLSLKVDSSCTDVDCYLPNGHCYNATCICSSGYTTFPSNSNPQCNYKRKSQLVAFLLHFFLGGFGVGEFYVGNISYGLAQIFLCFIIPMIFGFIVLFIYCYKNSLTLFMGNLLILIVLSELGFLIFWIVDIILFAQNSRLDSNGIILQPW